LLVARISKKSENLNPTSNEFIDQLRNTRKIVGSDFINPRAD